MKKLIETFSNKWPEYLLEILVLIIGIYGAFAVENWNDERKERQQEQELLKQLREQYESNLAQLDSKVATRNVIISSSKKLLNYYDNPQDVPVDSILRKLSNLALTVTYDPVSNDLVSSGKISIIQNQKLKSLLTTWSTDVIQVQEVEILYLDRFNKLTLPILIELGVGRSIDEYFWNSIQKLDFMLSNEEISTYDYGKSRSLPESKELLNNAVLEGIVSNSIMINDFINLESKVLRKQIEDILEILNSEIK